MSRVTLSHVVLEADGNPFKWTRGKQISGRLKTDFR